MRTRRKALWVTGLALWALLLGALVAAASGWLTVGTWDVAYHPPVASPPELEVGGEYGGSIDLDEDSPSYESTFSLRNVGDETAVYEVGVFGIEPNFSTSIDGESTATHPAGPFELAGGEEQEHTFGVAFNGDKTPEVYSYEQSMEIRVQLIEE